MRYNESMEREQRVLLAKGLVDLANIVAGALVFGQFLTAQQFNTRAFGTGLLLTGALYLAGLGFSKGQTNKTL